jgi:hypothetical protein
MDVFIIELFTRVKHYINNEYFNIFILKNTFILLENNYKVTVEQVQHLFIRKDLYTLAENILRINMNISSNRATKIKQIYQEMCQFMELIDNIVNYQLKDDFLKLTENDITNIGELFVEIITELHYIQRQYSHELSIKNNIQYLDSDKLLSYIFQSNYPSTCPCYEKLEKAAEEEFQKYIFISMK